MQSWRLVPPIKTSGAIQMAIDEWLLDQHRAGLMPPILRFYTWSPAAISLGYGQRDYPNTWNTLHWHGHPIEIVRRPSGGRAVLHQGDLTYAIIISERFISERFISGRDISGRDISGRDISGRDISEREQTLSKREKMYRFLCQFLIDGLQSFGLDLAYGTAGRGYIHNPNCFATATAADLILADGTKLIGSAQLRRGSAILQHGSIRIAPDPDLFHHVFGLDASLESVSHRWPQSRSSFGQPDMDAIIAGLVLAARHCFAMDCRVQPLSPDEWNTVLAQSYKWHKPQQERSQ